MDLYQFHVCWRGDRHRPILLLLHGFMGNAMSFEPALDHLAQTFCCLTVDLPGHGQTQVYGGAQSYGMAHTAQGLIRLLDQLQIRTCHLLGYSMGGRLALYLMLYFPQRFDRVVLESASPGLRSGAERQARRQRDAVLAQTLETSDFPEFLQHWYRQPLFSSLRQHPGFAGLLQARLQQPSLAGLAQSLRHLGLGCQPSLWAPLAQAHHPLLLLVGSLDRKFRAINAEMASICPTATLQVMPQVSHNIHFEQPAAFAEAVIGFLQTPLQNESG